jgi:hypothetical protein
MLSDEKQADATKGDESTDENEQALFNVCGTSGVQTTGEAEEVADGIDRMIEEGGKDYSEQVSLKN